MSPGTVFITLTILTSATTTPPTAYISSGSASSSIALTPNPAPSLDMAPMSSGGLTTHQKVGLGVGIGLGATILLAAAMGVWLGLGATKKKFGSEPVKKEMSEPINM